jgi:glycosyltransferase involved in cell wall biosynthesis
MKLIYITNARIPTEKAHGYQIGKMCEEFSKSGVEVELWVPTRRNRIKKDIFSFYNLEKNFKVKYVKSANFLQYEKYIGKYSLYLQSIFFLFKLLFIKVEEGAIVYTRNPEIGWLFSLRGRKIVYEAHVWPGSKVGLYLFLIRRINKIVIITHSIKKLFLKNNFAPSNILVAPDGVDLKEFDIPIVKVDARKKLDLPQEKIILGFTGSFKTMGRDKGLVDTLKALAVLIKEGSDICLVVVGGHKNDIDYYFNLARKMGVEKNIFLIERVDLKKLAIYQKAFDILLMPFPNTKHYALFMSPLKMFEYMASKRPIITSDLPSIREILNESNSVLVEPDNALSLANGIRRVMRGKELSDRISKQAFLDVQDYTWGKRVKNIINFAS